MLGAFDDSGSLVGIVIFIRENSIKIIHKGNVYGIYDEPEMRGQVLGKSLMLELMEWLLRFI